MLLISGCFGSGGVSQATDGSESTGPSSTDTAEFPTSATQTEPTPSDPPAVPTNYVEGPTTLVFPVNGSARFQIVLNTTLELFSWSSPGPDHSLTLVYPSGALDDLGPPCEGVPSGIRRTMSFAGHQDHLDFGHDLGPGLYQVEIFSVGRTEIRIALGGDSPPTLQAAGSASPWNATFGKVEDFRVAAGPPYRVEFDAVVAVDRPSLFFGAFLATPNMLVGPSTNEAYLDRAGGERCASHEDETTVHADAGVVARGNHAMGLNATFIPTGAYEFSGAFETTVARHESVFPEAQAGYWLVSYDE